MPVKYLLRIMLVGFSPCEIYVVITTKDSAAVLMNTFKINREMIVEGCDDDEIISNLIHRISKFFVSIVWYRNFLWQCVAEDRTTIDKYLKENRL